MYQAADVAWKHTLAPRKEAAMAATRTETLRRIPSPSRRWFWILARVVMIVAIAGVLLFTFAPRDTAPVASPAESVAQVSAPPAVQEIVQVPQVEKPVIGEIVQVPQVEKPVVYEPGSPMNPLPPEAVPTALPLAFEKMEVVWSVAPEGIDIPPRGEEPLSGTIEVGTAGGGIIVGVGMNTPERREWFEEHLPQIDIVHGVTGVAAQDGTTIFAVATYERTVPVTVRSFLSRDNGSTWVELNMPRDWPENIVWEARVIEGDAPMPTTLFFIDVEDTWWMATVN